ncbi:hypothetical protein HN51_018457 [Arachis hypogaea]|nr:protein FANTASTIC FOUR [Arachis hypogaea]
MKVPCIIMNLPSLASSLYLPLMASSFTSSKCNRCFTTCSNNINGDDDYIGAESCMDLQNDIVEIEMEKKQNVAEKLEKKRELPPPIRLLCNTHNSKSSWALKRYRTSDGRLILREEKVKGREYFQAHRSNGRLILQLIPLGDDDAAAEERDENDNNHKGTTLGGEPLLCLNCNSSSSSSRRVFRGPPIYIGSI